MNPIQGLHHITAVTRDAQKNVDFYRTVLGQRMVKRTVNFDDPGTYHLYFADAVGTPGSVITFFAWQGMRPAVRGNGTTNALAYNVPANAMNFWREHLEQNRIHTQEMEQRFGAEVLAFDDPDGMRIELIAEQQSPTRPWVDGPIDPRYALQGFHSATLWLDEVIPTAELLTRHMGYTISGQEDSRYRFTGGASALGSVIDIVHNPDGNRAVFGAGSIHHIAFRVPDDAAQLEYQQSLLTAGFHVTPVQDRSYFHSIYFREPGGVLFEIATNTPGFGIDEPQEALGETLRLPPWVEPQREAIENSLPPIQVKPVQRAVYVDQTK